MKIVLISLIDNFSVPAIRCLSSYLKTRGYNVNLILLARSLEDGMNEDSSFLYSYPDIILKEIKSICTDSDLIGISMMSCHFDNAVYITRYLKDLNIPIVWGGIHPTLNPAECLKYTDMVCVGEGEIAFSELISEMSKGKNWKSLSIPGIYKNNDKEFRPSPIIQNLDEIPSPDYDLDNQFIIYKGRLVHTNTILLQKAFGYAYTTYMSRGCIYACKFCSNNALRKLYQHKLPIRWRSPENCIKEIKMALNIMPKLNRVMLMDDSFLVAPIQIIKKFATRYKQIGLPLSFLVTPKSISESKLKLLAKAGGNSIRIGIQSGSERIRNLYGRRETIKDILSASDCIKFVNKKTKTNMIPVYDLILDNPWENDQDIEDTIRLCMKLNKPFSLALFSLKFYIGTELYEKAKKEGIITDDLNQIYRQSQLVPSHSYLNGVLTAVSYNTPNWIISLLLCKPIRNLNLVNLPYFIGSVFSLIQGFKIFLNLILTGNWLIAKSYVQIVKKIVTYQALLLRRKTLKRDTFYGMPGCLSR